MTTYIRLNQIRKADTFDDTLSPASIAAVEGTAIDDEDFLGGMLSQIKRIVLGSTAGNWYDAVESVVTDPRGLKAITDDIYYKRILRRRLVTTDVTVGAGNNFVVLSAATETPGETAAVNAGSANGAVCATLPADVGAWSSNAVAGLNGISPKNLCLVRDATNFDPILSGGREIMALLQAESGVVDGDTFNNTTKQVQLSFVRQDATGTTLEAVPVADIESKGINYLYVSRSQLYTLNEQDFLFSIFQDPQSASATTLDQAYIAGNQINVVTAEGHLIFDLSQDLTEFRILRGGSSFGTFKRDDTLGDSLTLDLDTLDVNNVNDADFAGGAKFDTGGTTINVGSTAGQVDATILVARATAGDLTLRASDDVMFQTVRETTALPLDDATAGAISALPGGPYASVSAAIRSAITASDIDAYVQVLQANYAQDINVPGSGNGNAQDWSPALDLSARTISMNSGSIASLDTLLFLNGRLLFGGDGATNNDVYAGTTPSGGDLKYDFVKGVKSGDVVIAVSWKQG